jgi:GTP-binding protein
MPFQIEGKWIELVDTGGWGFVDADNLTQHIMHQIEQAMARADLVLFIVDCKEGLTTADSEVASLLRRKGLKTVILANKADSQKADVMLGDFGRLGLGTPIPVSAMNDRGLHDVADALVANLDLANAPTEMPEPQMLVAIVGKRNAGKSTLVNSIAEIYEGHGDRVIVSEVPGTTRDSVDVRFDKDGKTLIVIDTAGVRKKRHMVTNDIEFYSFHRAQRSIRRADVVLMLIDATQPVSEPDQKLAQYIAEQHKPVVLVVNKWDLAKASLRSDRKEGARVPSDSEVMEEYRKYLDLELKHLDFAPIAFITAKEGKNVGEVLDLSAHLYKQSHTRVTTSRLNEAMEQVLAERTPSSPKGRRPKIYYGTQTGIAPPTIVLFVNNADNFDQSFRRFVVNRFRELLPFDEVPMKLEFRGKGEQGKDAEGKPARDQIAGLQQDRKGRLRKSKPQPKKGTHKGPKRGTRPH